MNVTQIHLLLENNKGGDLMAEKEMRNLIEEIRKRDIVSRVRKGEPLYEINVSEAKKLINWFLKRLTEESITTLKAGIHTAIMDCGIILKFDYDDV